MSLGKFAVDAIKAWNPLSPEAHARRDRNKAFRKARRKAKRGEPLTEQESQLAQSVNQEEPIMSETTKSFLRTILKIAGSALVTKGVIDAGDATSLQVAIEALVGGIAGIVGIYLSHKKHAATA